MKSWLSPFLVGLLMLAAGAAFIFMIGTVSEDLMDGQDGYTLNARIADATGLTLNGRVMIAGIPVGTVDAVALEGSQALVTILVREDVVLYQGVEEVLPDGTRQWRNGATMVKKTASLLGDYYLELTPGLEGPRLVDGDAVPNIIQPVSTDSLMAQVSTIATHLEVVAQDVRSVTANLAEVLGDEEGLQRLDTIARELEATTVAISGIAQENRAQIAAIVDNVEAVTGDARGVVQEVRSLVVNVGDDADRVMADVQALSSELRTLVARSSGDVAGSLETARATLDRLEAAAESLQYSLDNVEVISDRIVDGEGTIGRLVNDPAIANETQTLLENANGLVGGVSRLQTWVELRTEYDAEASALKNYLSLSFRPHEDKFYIFELVDDPRGSTETILESRLQSDPDEPGDVYDETTRTTDAFRITLLLGRRWDVTGGRRSLLLGGRWGIIESTGGLGFDAWLWRERLQVRGDIFDFTASTFPRWRLLAFLQLDAFAPRSALLSHLFVQGGLDDVLNPDTRSWFLGGGIRFNDLDLKGLLIAAPTPSF
jgi:phospholipid/cholesterol/gamma-HCH transport system substrate-binding protein